MTMSAPELSELVNSPSLTEAIVRFVVDTRADALPESARQMARLSLLDWIAVTVAGSNEPVSRIVRQMAIDDGGAPDATIVGEKIRLPARAAAMVNGTASHALDYDDTNHYRLVRMGLPDYPVAMGVIRSAASSVYESDLYHQVQHAKKETKIRNMDELLRSGNVFESKG